MSTLGVYHMTTGATRTVVNEIPGGVRSLLRMQLTLKIALLCCYAFYGLMGAMMECPLGEHLAWYATFFTLWTTGFGWFAAWIENQD